MEKPPASPVTERRGPPFWGKLGVSLLVVVHFFAITTAVTSAGSTMFPAPDIVVWVKNWVTRPYLQFVFLTNPYRFYAPNPGPTPVLWFRLEYQDGTARWLELPRRQDWPIRMPYQRHLCAVMLFDQMAGSISPEEPGVRRLSPEGRIAACSFARYAARKYPRMAADGSLVPVKEVALYSIMHLVMEPWQVRNGWETTDMRLHMPFYVGTFGADGLQLDAGTTTLQYRPISDLAAHMLARDIYPLFRQHPDKDRAELLDEIGAPPAIRSLFYRFPQLLKPDEMDRPDLKDIIEQLHGTIGIPPERLPRPDAS
jgi:hypothetical protein